MVEIKKLVPEQEVSDYKVHHEYPVFGAYRKRNKFVKILNDRVWDLPAPVNLNAWWRFGSLLGLCLVIQLVTGFLLACHYTPHVDMAYNSVIHIIRDVPLGWCIRRVHANGASIFFFCIYAHIGRGIYYGSYHILPTWNVGVILYLMLIGIAFLGYVLPWGQISYWGCTVITSIVTAIPYVGHDILHWVWGGYVVCNNTLVRFYALHFILPFLMVVLVIIHLYFLHQTGSRNPLGVDASVIIIRFHPFYTLKDGIGFSILGGVLIFFVCFYPELLGNKTNWIKADSIKTPSNIRPEWYFCWLYTILRAIPSKSLGIISILRGILILFILPFLHTGWCRRLAVYPLSQFLFWGLVSVFFMLTIGGIHPVDYPWDVVGKLLTVAYFCLIVLVPLSTGLWDWLVTDYRQI